MLNENCGTDFDKLPIEAKIIHNVGHSFVRDKNDGDKDSTINEDTNESLSDVSKSGDDGNYFISRKVSEPSKSSLNDNDSQSKIKIQKREVKSIKNFQREMQNEMLDKEIGNYQNKKKLKKELSGVVGI